MASLPSPRVSAVRAELDQLYQRRKHLVAAIENLERYARMAGKPVRSAGPVIPIHLDRTRSTA